MVAFTDIIRRESSNSLSEKDRKHLDVIKRNGLRLKEMIDDLLELSSIHANEPLIGRPKFTIQEVFSRLTASMQPMIDAKFQKVVMNFPRQISRSSPTAITSTRSFRTWSQTPANTPVNIMRSGWRSPFVTPLFRSR
jgi:signal transduction histidine kinase